MKTLMSIAQKHKTDKASPGHGYIPLYEKYFNPLREKNLNILEIGIRREVPGTAGACSLRTWKEYFPNSQIYGVDIDPKNKEYEEERIEIFIGNQGDENFLNNVVKNVGNFDIVIDDGSHVNALTIASYNGLWPSLKSGGLYIIEDLGCGYINLDEQLVRSKASDESSPAWWGMNLLPEDISYDNNRADFLNFIQEKLTRMDLGSSDRWRNKFGLSGPDVHNISFYKNICFITKL